jgi:acyl-CoA thioester hydrolase
LIPEYEIPKKPGKKHMSSIGNRQSTIGNLLLGFPVRVEMAVAWGEMDSYRHVNNVVYFRYFENARLEYFRRLDWFAYERDTGIGPILAATQARFRRPVTYPDTVVAAVRVTSLAKDRFTMEYRLVSHELAEVAAEGQGTIVTYHYPTGRKVAMPDELRQRVAALEASKQE